MEELAAIEAVLVAELTKAWAEQDHPRSAVGQFDAKGSGAKQNPKPGGEGKAHDKWRQDNAPLMGEHIHALREALQETMSKDEIQAVLLQMRQTYHETGELVFPAKVKQAVVSTTTQKEWEGLKGMVTQEFNRRVDALAKSTVSYAVTKADGEKRYTLGPFYIPNREDAHGEWVTQDDLQEGVWDYVRKGYRDIHLQHSDKRAGEWVEFVSWPYATEVQLSLPGELAKSTRTETLPAGTAYMGVVWEPWAWDLVKAGKLRGLSMGGFASRIEADFTPELAKAFPPKKQPPQTAAPTNPATDNAVAAEGAPPGVPPLPGQTAEPLPPAEPEPTAEELREEERAKVLEAHAKKMWAGVEAAWARSGLAKACGSCGELHKAEENHPDLIPVKVLDEQVQQSRVEDTVRWLQTGPTPGRMLELADLVDADLEPQQMRALLALDGDEAFDLLIVAATELFGNDTVKDAIDLGPDGLNDKPDEFEALGETDATAEDKDGKAELDVAEVQKYSDTQARANDGKWVSGGIGSAVGFEGRVEVGLPSSDTGPAKDMTPPKPTDRDEHFDVDAAKGSIDRKLAMGGFMPTSEGVYSNEFGETIEVKTGKSDVTIAGASFPSVIVTEKDPSGKVTRSERFQSKEAMNASAVFGRMGVEQAMRDEVGMPTVVKALRWVIEKFSATQARDSHGRWTDGGGTYTPENIPAVSSGAREVSQGAAIEQRARDTYTPDVTPAMSSGARETSSEAAKLQTQQHLVDYKAERELTGSDAKRISSVIKGAKTVGYMDAPGIDKMHSAMGIKPNPQTPVGPYMDARNALFKAEPVTQVPLSKLTFTQPNINEDRARELTGVKAQLDLPVFVLKDGDNYSLMNGHHRVVASAMNGAKSINAHVLDVS